MIDTMIYGVLTIHSADGTGKWINQGYDGFAPLIDSGISVYIWTNAKFLSVLIYTSKKFETKKALTFTKKFFKITKIESMEF